MSFSSAVKQRPPFFISFLLYFMYELNYAYYAFANRSIRDPEGSTIFTIRRRVVDAIFNIIRENRKEYVTKVSFSSSPDDSPNELLYSRLVLATRPIYTRITLTVHFNRIARFVSSSFPFDYSTILFSYSICLLFHQQHANRIVFVTRLSILLCIRY